VGYDYVRAMNLKILDGRDFSKEIVTDSVGYLINEAALKIMKFKNPVGAPLQFWEHKGKVVGVLKDFHFQSLHQPILPLIIRLNDNERRGNALIRIEGGKTKEALSGLEKIWKELNPSFPFNYQFADEEYQKLYTSEQVVGKLARYFAGLAIFICCLGLLGLAMFTAEQRIKEIGIRKVLGASVSSLFTLMSRDFLLLVMVAFLIAAPLGYWVMTNWLENFAYRTPVGVWIFVFAGMIAVIITLFTVSFQALKAAMANPVRNLRSE
jgi:ABC-type antimicrobial peptide transport system permease subunit